MHSLQYTGGQSETGMVLMEVEMVSGAVAVDDDVDDDGDGDDDDDDGGDDQLFIFPSSLAENFILNLCRLGGKVLRD